MFFDLIIPATETTAGSKETKRRSIFDRFFSRSPKRARTIMAENGPESRKVTNESANDSKVGGANVTVKPSLELSRKKEVKQRLNAEASREIRPIAIGTLAMMVSALSNQGMAVWILGVIDLRMNFSFPLSYVYQHSPSSWVSFWMKKARLSIK